MASLFNRIRKRCLAQYDWMKHVGLTNRFASSPMVFSRQSFACRNKICIHHTLQREKERLHFDSIIKEKGFHLFQPFPPLPSKLLLPRGHLFQQFLQFTLTYIQSCVTKPFDLYQLPTNEEPAKCFKLLDSVGSFFQLVCKLYHPPPIAWNYQGLKQKSSQIKPSSLAFSISVSSPPPGRFPR